MKIFLKKIIWKIIEHVANILTTAKTSSHLKPR